MLRLENISMAVNDNNGENREIIHGISTEFKPGKIYAVTGPNGGGKTSIAKLIMGIYKANTGRIFLIWIKAFCCKAF